MTNAEITLALFDKSTTTGFTFRHNKLDDFLLANLPCEYYCIWQFLWRSLYGWTPPHESLSLRAIANGSSANVSVVSRALWFFHATELIKYTPGYRGHNSHFELFPRGVVPELSHVSKIIAVLNRALAEEKSHRKTDRHYRYTNDQFRGLLSHIWQQAGEQVVSDEEPYEEPGMDSDGIHDAFSP